MARVYLKFNLAVIKEYDLKKQEMTFGRKPSNDIVIENPAISGFHGKILKEGDQFYVEDLNSTNGTFVNGQRVKKTALKNKDQIGVARHVLEFVTDSSPAPAAPLAPPVIGNHSQSSTQPLEGEKELSLDKLRESLGLPPKETPAPPPPAPVVQAAPVQTPPPPPPVESPVPARPAMSAEQFFSEKAQPAPAASASNSGVIRIIAGNVGGQTEIKLKDLVTYIGTSDQAIIKIKGLMAPSLAAAISKRPEGYFLKAVKAGYPKVNGNAVQEQVLLENGALIEVGGTNMVFYHTDAVKGDK